LYQKQLLEEELERRMSNRRKDALAKPYDSRLMHRLLQYMRPYKWRVNWLVLVAIVTPLE